MTAPLPSHRFLGSLTVLGEADVYCIAPDPDDESRGLRVWRWVALVRATDGADRSKWVEQCGERAHRVIVMWAEKAVEEEREACAKKAQNFLGDGTILAAAIRARGAR